jgi:hypothetical protein
LRAPRTLAVAALSFAVAAPAAALTIEASFDPEPDGVVRPPFVGTGVVSFTTLPEVDTYVLSEIADLQMTFVVDGITFTEADASSRTPLTDVAMHIVDTPAGLAFRFNNIGEDGGFGALDLVVDGQMLAFEPGYGDEFYRGPDDRGPILLAAEIQPMFPEGSYYGDFGPSQVPLPPAAAGLIAGLGALGFAARRRRG